MPGQVPISKWQPQHSNTTHKCRMWNLQHYWTRNLLLAIHSSHSRVTRLPLRNKLLELETEFYTNASASCTSLDEQAPATFLEAPIAHICPFYSRLLFQRGWLAIYSHSVHLLPRSDPERGLHTSARVCIRDPCGHRTVALCSLEIFFYMQRQAAVVRRSPRNSGSPPPGDSHFCLI